MAIVWPAFVNGGAERQMANPETRVMPGRGPEAAPAPITVILNAAAGARDKAAIGRRLAMLFRDHGVAAEIHLIERGAEAAGWARRAVAAGTGVVVAGGGDGTVSSVAAVLAGTGVPLGVLPLGTFNYFARNLGIPLDLEDAVHTLVHGRVISVNLGELNGRPFVNTSSLGLHSRILTEAERYKARLGRRRWVAVVSGIRTVLQPHPLFSIRLGVGATVTAYRTPLVFVGNNRLQAAQFDQRAGTCLDAGQLSLYVMHPVGRWGLLRLVLKALFRRAADSPGLDLLCLQEGWIETPRRILSVSLDGEVVPMRSPLHYRVRPAALRVIVPAGEAGAVPPA